ncbi:PTS system fructose-specific EIIA component [bioreactor metagenome]|uniref:PTS system fructose-specific EIIA component n=1 Tax=bioreactor metagenome TaxID=1076179 RepID=A0A645CQ51_9ZZZZ|nr:PTS sugar transporter subunit IIA [Christensenella sp.]
MIELILVSHGSFAAGLREAAEMILGEQEQVYVLGLYQGDSPDSFSQKLEELIGEAQDCKNVLVLSDLQSGTPYNAGMVMAMKRGSACIAGTNLPMLLEILSLRDEMEMEELLQVACSTGRSGIVNSTDLLANYKRKEESK